VRCRWLSPDESARAPSADIIRIIVDDRRGNSDGHSVTEVYQQRTLREIGEFIGRTRAVLVTPAGFVTTRINWPENSVQGIENCLSAAQTCMDRLDLGSNPLEVLLGLDGCVPCEATPFQAATHLSPGKKRITLEKTAVKLYGPSAELATLIGWRVCNQVGEIPKELLVGHCVQTSIGKLLVFVCHESVLFSSRSQKNLQDELWISLRDHFRRKAIAEPRPRYAVILTHWQAGSGHSGGTFLNAATNLATETGITVVTAMRTPIAQLEDAALRFVVLGPDSDRVATLLVEDTWKEPPG
jgi:hypothetical protein